MTTLIEDIQPSGWFKSRWQDWQRDLQMWHSKHLEFKDPAKRAALIAAALKKKDEREKKLTEENIAGGEKNDKDKENNADNEKGKDATGAEKAKEGEKDKDDEKGAEKGKEDEKDKDGEKGEKPVEEKDPMQLFEEELDRQELDIFGVDDIMDMGTGEPLFSSFAFEDWALLSLRFELHLLVHSFMRDCNDTERTGIDPDHLAYYYTKYYKKALNPKSYGVETVKDLIFMVSDTVVPVLKVVESQLDDDLETNEVFVKLTEEARRERQRRLDSGDQTAQLKFQRPQDRVLSMGAAATGLGMTGMSAATGLGMTAMRPSLQGSAMVTPAGPGIVQRTPGLSIPQLLGAVGKGGLQYGFGSPRPQQWQNPRFPQTYGAARPGTTPQLAGLSAARPGTTPQLGGLSGPRSAPYQQPWRFNAQ